MKRFRNYENISDKKYDFIQIEQGYVYKISSKTFIKGAELNPQKMPKNNIKSSQKNFGRKQIFLREISKNQLK